MKTRHPKSEPVTNETASIPAAAATAPSTPAVFALPPPGVTVPAPPGEFDPNAPATFASTMPKKAEIAALPGAVKELASFSDYALVFGTTAPTLAHLVAALTAAAAWSVVYASSSLWMKYVQASVSTAWKDARQLIEGLKVPFALASAKDPTLTTRFPSLTRLLGVAKDTSMRAQATIAANKKAKAEGKPPIHGKVGAKLRKKLKLAEPAPATASQPPSPAPAPAPAGTSGTHSA